MKLKVLATPHAEQLPLSVMVGYIAGRVQPSPPISPPSINPDIVPQVWSSVLHVPQHPTAPKNSPHHSCNNPTLINPIPPKTPTKKPNNGNIQHPPQNHERRTDRKNRRHRSPTIQNRPASPHSQRRRNPRQEHLHRHKLHRHVPTPLPPLKQTTQLTPPPTNQLLPHRPLRLTQTRDPRPRSRRPHRRPRSRQHAQPLRRRPRRLHGTQHLRRIHDLPILQSPPDPLINPALPRRSFDPTRAHSPNPSARSAQSRVGRLGTGARGRGRGGTVVMSDASRDRGADDRDGVDGGEDAACEGEWGGGCD